jgi:hypothetical protein
MRHTLTFVQEDHDRLVEHLGLDWPSNGESLLYEQAWF